MVLEHRDVAKNMVVRFHPLPPKLIIKLKEMRMFFRYYQNNSGGSIVYDPDRGISSKVYIEANSPREANRRAEGIGLYFDGNGDCDCCGNRWTAFLESECEVGMYGIVETPPLEGDPADDFSWVEVKPGQFQAFVHKADGSFYGTRLQG